MRVAVLMFMTSAIHCSVWASDRIVSLDPGVTEILMAMDKTDRVIATDSSKTLADKPVVGYYRQIPAEGLLSTQPSMVIANQDLGPKTLPKLIERSGVDFVEIKKPEDLTTLKTTIALVGQAIACNSCTEKVTAELDQKAQRLRQLANRNHQRAIFLLMVDERNMRIAGTGTGGSSLLELLGTDNAVTHAGYRPISMEGLLALKPDLILMTSRGDNASTLDGFWQQWPIQSNINVIPVKGEAVIAGVSLTMVDTALEIQSQLKQPSDKHASN